MKKQLHAIMLLCMIFLFIMCRKEITPHPGETPTSNRSLTAAAIREWQFNSPGDKEGWTGLNDSFNVSGGAMNVTTTSNDPQLFSPNNLNITAPSVYKYVRISLKNNTNITSARIFFTTTADSSWSQAKSKSFAIIANNTYYASYIIDMSTVSGWSSGAIKQLRFDPLDPAASGGGQTVNIDYIGITEVVTNVKEWGFDVDSNLESWAPGNANAVVAGGIMTVTTTGSDPLLLSPDQLGITNPAKYKYVHIEMKNNSGVKKGRIFFITDADGTWSQAKSKGFSINDNTSYYGSYIVDMSTVAGWTGTIRRIRVDPLDDSTVTAGQTVNIDFIRITDNQSYRGVMSPGAGFVMADAGILRNTWRANVMRWQLWSGDNFQTLAEYDTWLNGKIRDLDSAFNWCEPLGLRLLIDMHFTPMGHDSTKSLNIFYNQAANDKLLAAWQMIAARYKDRPALYGYGLINEPLQWQAPLAGCDFKSTQIRIGNAIRAIDRKTPIFIAVDTGDNPVGYRTFTPVPVPNVIYEVHMYEPHEYTQQFTSAQYNTAYTYPGTINGTYTDKARLTDLVGAVRTFQTTYSARVHVGEFSAARYAGGAAQYLRDCIDIFEGYGWSWTYHAYREAKVWNLQLSDQPREDSLAMPDPNTDRYQQVVGYGLNMNQ